MHIAPNMIFYIPPGWIFARRAVSKYVAIRFASLYRSQESLTNCVALLNILPTLDGKLSPQGSMIDGSVKALEQSKSDGKLVQ